MRRAELEALLEQVPPPPTARPEREQVRTPPGVAADLLWRMHEEEAVAGRRVLDLGCGTGILAWGATALGAAEVLGVDADGEAVAAARGLALAAPPPRFVVADLTDWHPEPAWDAVVMNPPFGAQRADRHADRVFYRRAAEAVAGEHGSAWFLAQPRTQPFLRAQAADVGASLTRVAAWRYPLQAFYAHHTEDVRLLDVAAYRLVWA